MQAIRQMLWEAAHLRFCNANDGSFNGEGSSKCSEDYLEEGETTVGTGINISHVSASPIGIEVNATAEVTDVNGRE